MKRKKAKKMTQKRKLRQKNDAKPKTASKKLPVKTKPVWVIKELSPRHKKFLSDYCLTWNLVKAAKINSYTYTQAWLIFRSPEAKKFIDIYIKNYTKEIQEDVKRISLTALRKLDERLQSIPLDKPRIKITKFTTTMVGKKKITIKEEENNDLEIVKEALKPLYMAKTLPIGNSQRGAEEDNLDEIMEDAEKRIVEMAKELRERKDV